MSRKTKWGGFLACCLLLGLVLIFGNAKTTQAATKCKVTFVNSKGKASNSTYRKWNNQFKNGVTKGTKITLPSWSKSGYQPLWAIKDSKGKITKLYYPGKKATISKNTTFYLLFYKKYTIRFYSSSGKTQYSSLSKSYTALSYEGGKITLPKIPVSNTSSYICVGWKTSKTSETFYKPGSKYKITANTNFYIATMPRANASVKLYTTSGKLWKTVNNSSGTATFPEVGTQNGSMVLGWSKVKGQSQKPAYYAGDTIPTGSNKYYMVTFTQAQDTGIVTNQDLNYKTVIFVGDSRTVGLEQAVSGSTSADLNFVNYWGSDLEWLKSDGYTELINTLKHYSKTDKIAIVMNHGVNDLGNANNYVTYMNKLAKNIKVTRGYKNVKFYYMSINPVNAKMETQFYGSASRTTAKIYSFNSTIYKKLCKVNGAYFTYINTNTYLMKYGWISLKRNGYYDGLHYSKNTYIRIYNYCVNYYLSK